MFPTIDMEETGKRFQELREEKGLSVRDIQEALHFTSTSTVYRWQSGQCLPKLENLVVLSAMFDTTIDSLLVVNK